MVLSPFLASAAAGPLCTTRRPRTALRWLVILLSSFLVIAAAGVQNAPLSAKMQWSAWRLPLPREARGRAVDPEATGSQGAGGCFGIGAP